MSDAKPSSSASTTSTPRTDDINIRATQPLVTPGQIKRDQPMSAESTRVVIESREVIKNILAGEDDRLLVIIGPCSIHDEAAALDYAERLAKVQKDVMDRLYVVMRVYFEKPRTTVGWKGLINDPHLDGTFDMEGGIRLARKLLLEITGMGLPAGTELLDPITPAYIADLLSWAAIGARTTESQTHRQMASGLSMPVGYKNGTEGNLQVAIDAMQSARAAHSFLGIDGDGRTTIVHTAGNPWGHVILRGGRGGPNYEPAQTAEASSLLTKAGLYPGLTIDCSHANSGKKFENQSKVWESVIDQVAHGNEVINGVLVESNINEGAQKLTDDLSSLKYGVSITDECIGWDETERLLRTGYEKLAK